MLRQIKNHELNDLWLSKPWTIASTVFLLLTGTSVLITTFSQPNRLSAAETLVAISSSGKLPDQVSFNAHIRPLMSNTCFTCHGPDSGVNESGFRIDSFDSATGVLPSDDDMVGIVPGDPMKSEVFLRLIDQGSGEQMPPGDFRHQLSDYDKALFRKWIKQGANYEQHWSYSPIVRVDPPTPQQQGEMVFNEIDAFVVARLETEGLGPSELADKSTLLRRLSLDLTGLPPTSEELQTFLADTSPDAYAKQVERLLKSERYGERMASAWLDAVRFADTVGFHGDQNLRNAPYRSYVINALNENKPFDQFTREQIAGDLLPNPTPEQLTATGALRLNMVTREGGAQPGEYLSKYKADRVRTLGTAWLGSTLACCECHNHKYDPFSAKDFYSFGAFFDDLRQWGVYTSYGYTPNPDLSGFNNDYPFPPEMRVDSESGMAEIKFLQDERNRKLLTELGEETLDSKRFKDWSLQMANLLKQHPSGWVPAEINNVATDKETPFELIDGDSVLQTGDPKEGESITLNLRPQTPSPMQSLRLEILPDDQNGGNVGRSDDGRFSLSLKASIQTVEAGEPARVPIRPQFVRVELSGKQILSLAEVQVFVKGDDGELKNIATQGSASHSSNYSSGEAALAIDGETEGKYRKANSVTHTSLNGVDPWWEVDLGAEHKIENISIWNRTDGDYGKRLNGFRLVLLDKNRKSLHVETPALPKPSIEVTVPDSATPHSVQNIKMAWAEADRESPSRYSSGAPPLVLGGTWRSGPDRWQLPANEQTLPHTAIYHFDRPITLDKNQQLVVKVSSSDVGRLRISTTPLGHSVAGWDDASMDLASALETLPNVRDEQTKADLVAAYHHGTTPYSSQSSISKSYRDKILRLHSGKLMTLVAQSLPSEQIPISRIQPRGNWLDESGELAPPAFPSFLPGSSRESERRLTRLDLADWIVSPQNPLTSRHYVNRLWKQFFGAGLSGKLDDLGNQGEWPSHPLLLDWLASEFIASGWDIKHVVRKIVFSRTYQQAAAVRDDLADIDPYNRLLAQQSARRLDAEIIRDNALAIAGLLNTQYVGGTSVFPYQPDGHYSNLQFPNRRYQSTTDGRQYRRGVYMHWQRTFLHPMLVNFDAPSRDECSADRSLSNSPQQALTLLNDPQFVEAAIAFAERLVEFDTDFNQQLQRGFLLALSREPTQRERQSLSELYQRQLNYFSDHPDEADKTLGAGMLEVHANDKASQAALTQVCRVILNLHETITRY